MKSLKLALAGALATGLALGAGAASAEIQQKEFRVVGTWGFLSQWKDHESRFWNKVLPEASGGKLTANAKPYTELGLSGFEIMRQLKLGVFDAAHALTSYTASDSPAIEGADLAGVVQDLGLYRKVLDVYRPVIEKELLEKYNATVLMMYSFPSQQLWCNMGDKSVTKVSLKDLAGKKIRTYSTTLGDFIEGLGASAVTIAFAEVVPALQRGVADCGTTGTMPAYSAKWGQVVTHNIRVRLGYAATFMAMNQKSWAGLNPDTQALVAAMAKKVEYDMWDSTKIEDQAGMDCNASGPCKQGDPAGMVAIEPSAEDQAQLKSIVENFVLKRWADRCGKECSATWNTLLSDVTGVTIPN